MSLKVLYCIVLLIGVLGYSTAKSFDGFKVYEVTARSSADLLVLDRLMKDDSSRYEFFHKPALKSPSRVVVDPEKEKNFLDVITKNSLDFKVINENFGETIDRELRLHRLLRTLNPYRPGQRLGTERYYTHDEINAYIADLAQRYPQRAYVKTVGKSYEGRELKTITISNGDGRKHKNVILMDGGFHAREWISPAVAVYIIGELVENFQENAELLLDYDWVVLPVVNADGYEYTQLSQDTRLWRKTRKPYPDGTRICYGVDPNRNFGFHWNEIGSSIYPCDDTYAGPKPFSEPEAVTVRDLIHTFSGRGIMYLTLHSYGSLLLYPWGYADVLPETWPDLHEVAMVGADAISQATGNEYTVGSSTQVLYAAAGASDDYAFYSGFPISYTMELPPGGQYGFDLPASEIDFYVKESWVGIRAMARKLNEKYPRMKRN